MRQIAVTSRLVCTAAATSRLRLVCRCDMSHKFKPLSLPHVVTRLKIWQQQQGLFEP